ncbi:MAG: hypothetical protein KF861_24220, partial [Planctomycetaceae bacterium]|nr:hypothetical protein [Planctomycetaceae bacterium]
MTCRAAGIDERRRRRRRRQSPQCVLQSIGRYAVLAVLTTLAPVSADSPPRAERPVIREAFVPADNPDVWPKGTWIARPVREYRQLREAVAEKSSRPPSAALSQI